MNRNRPQRCLYHWCHSTPAPATVSRCGTRWWPHCLCSTAALRCPTFPTPTFPFPNRHDDRWADNRQQTCHMGGSDDDQLLTFHCCPAHSGEGRAARDSVSWARGVAQPAVPAPRHTTHTTHPPPPPPPGWRAGGLPPTQPPHLPSACGGHMRRDEEEGRCPAALAGLPWFTVPGGWAVLNACAATACPGLFCVQFSGCVPSIFRQDRPASQGVSDDASTVVVNRRLTLFCLLYLI